jgi:hypothetical protein
VKQNTSNVSSHINTISIPILCRKISAKSNLKQTKTISSSILYTKATTILRFKARTPCFDKQSYIPEHQINYTTNSTFKYQKARQSESSMVQAASHDTIWHIKEEQGNPRSSQEWGVAPAVAERWRESRR